MCIDAHSIRFDLNDFSERTVNFVVSDKKWGNNMFWSRVWLIKVWLSLSVSVNTACWNSATRPLNSAVELSNWLLTINSLRTSCWMPIEAWEKVWTNSKIPGKFTLEGCCCDIGSRLESWGSGKEQAGANRANIIWRILTGGNMLVVCELGWCGQQAV